MNKGEEICRCRICGKEMKLKNLQWHLRSHEIKPKDYYCKYIGEKKYCPTCGKGTPFEGITHGYKEGFCSYRCEQIANGIDVESDSYKKAHHCLICGAEVHQLRNHLRVAHGMTNKDYYDKYYKTENEGICPVCGKPTAFDRHFRYRDYCSITCMNKSEQHRKQVKQACLDKYGCEWFSQSNLIKAKIRAANIEKYGVEWAVQDDGVKQKIRETNLAKYGVASALSSPAIREKIEQTNLAKYGYKNPACSESVQEKIHQTSLSKYGTDRPQQSEQVREKMRQTNLERYGCNTPSKNPQIIAKAIETRTTNKSWNTSKVEDKVYSILLDVFGENDITRQYKEERYEYKCDFYIKSRDLFIELNAYTSHMSHWYDENNQEDVSKLEALLNSDKGYDNMCADAWVRETQKRELARQNNLNYVVFWQPEDADLWLSLGRPDGKDYIKEYSWLPDRPTLDPFCDFPKKLTDGTSTCRAVAKAANGDSLFYRECKMWEENKPHRGVLLQPWLYYNRLKYMDSHKNPSEITDAELIRGFTISGIIRGYSRYDVKPMKEILEEYNVRSVYDPCAGWGERLALCGAKGISYEGIDINEKVVEGHNKIISNYKLGNNYSSTHGDAADYTPKNSPDAVFTCPPYLDKEFYTEEGAENLPPEEFSEWWNRVCNNFPDSVEHVFIHIDEETKPYIISGLESNGWLLRGDRYVSKSAVSHFNRGKSGEIKKKNFESVLIFERVKV